MAKAPPPPNVVWHESTAPTCGVVVTAVPMGRFVRSTVVTEPADATPTAPVPPGPVAATSTAAPSTPDTSTTIRRRMAPDPTRVP